MQFYGCEWIDGDPSVELREGRDPHCGKKRVIGKPYCREHLERSVARAPENA
jgi:hypothetical protein